MKTAKKAKRLAHTLISVHLGDCIMHSYLMHYRASSVENEVNAMIGRLEEVGIKPVMPIWLVTTLGDATEMVRQIARTVHPDCAAMMDQATDYHFTTWLLPPEHPDNSRLMALH